MRSFDSAGHGFQPWKPAILKIEHPVDQSRLAERSGMSRDSDVSGVGAEGSMTAEAQIELMRQFVHRRLEPWPEFVAALIVGSVAHGEGRPDSDVDCVLVFDALNEAIVPAEFVWVPDTDTYHTIFEVDAVEAGGLQIDAKRVALDDFLHREWPESFKHELADAIILFDRHGVVGKILEKRVSYPESLRLSRLQDHLGWAQYYVDEWRLLGWIERGGIEGAHDQLTAAFEELLQLLHVYNGKWMPWRYRWMISARNLPWLPEDYPQKSVEITSRISPTRESVLNRRTEIVSLMDDILDQLQSEKLVADSRDAFISAHRGLGYAHNFNAWREAHQKLQESRPSPSS